MDASTHTPLAPRTATGSALRPLPEPAGAVAAGGALVASPGTFRASVAASPFSSARVETSVEAGQTLSGLLAQFNVPLDYHIVIKVNGVPVRRDMWPYVRPNAGTLVTLRVWPQGGDDSNPLAAIFAIGLAIVAPYIGGFIAGPAVFGLKAGLAFNIVTGLVGGLVGLAGAAVISSLVDSPRPRLGSVNNGFNRDPQVFGISGMRNSLPSPQQPVMSVFGTMRVHPFFAAQPYSFVAGNQQILQVLFDFGYGPLSFGSVSQMHIGNRPLAEFAGVQVWRDDGVPGTASAVNGFGNVPIQQQLSTTLNRSDGWRTFTTAPDTDEVQVDITFQGLIEFNDQGEKRLRTVQFEVQRQARSAGPWLSDNILGQSGATAFNRLNLPHKNGQIVTGSPGVGATSSITVRGTTTELKYTSVEIKFANAGTHRWRMRRTTADTTDSKIRDKAFITAITDFEYQRPVQATGRALVSLRMQASGQLNGVVDTFTTVVTRGVRTFDGSTWSTAYSYGVTASNPAWVFAEVIRGQGVPDAVRADFPDAKIDGAQLRTWANYCATKDLRFDGTVDGRDSLWNVLKDVASAGRAAPIIRDGDLLSVIIDRAQTVPVDIITPRTALEYRGKRSFEPEPHGLVCRYRDASDHYALKEITVYNDGYNAANATNTLVQELWGKTRVAEVYRQARYLMAEAKLRHESHEVTMDVQHIAFTRGDYVELLHDVPLVGVGQGRVVDVQPATGAATGMTLDTAIAMAAGVRYHARFQSFEGERGLYELNTVAGEQTTFTFKMSISADERPAIDTLVGVGVIGRETLPCVVERIRAFNDLSAHVTLLPLANAIHDVDSQPLPAFDPRITEPAALSLPEIEKPVIQAIVSDERVLLAAADGTVLNRIALEVSPPARINLSDAVLRGQIRRQGDIDFMDAPLQSADAGVFYFTGVDTRGAYTVRLRYETVSGLFPGLQSDWTVRDVTVVGQSTPPPPPTDFRIEGTVVCWRLNNAPLDVAGFRLRYRLGTLTQWDGALAAHDGLITANAFDLAGLPDELMTVLLKTVDTSGFESAEAAVIIRNLGDTEPRNIIFTRTIEDEGWPFDQNTASNLTLTDSFTQQQANIVTDAGTNLSVSTDAVFAARITVPLAGIEGILFSAGHATNRAYVGFGDGFLRFTTGTPDVFGVSTPDSAQDIELIIALSDIVPMMVGERGVLVWEYRINPGRIRVFWQGEQIGAQSTSAGGALRGSAWADEANNAGYGTLGDASQAGDFSAADFNGSIHSVLKYYGAQLVTNTQDNNLLNGTRITSANLLRADDDGATYLDDDTGLYLPDPLALYLETQYLPMTYTVSHLPSYHEVGATLRLNPSVTADGFDLRYKDQGSSLYLPGDADQYIPDDDGAYLPGPAHFNAWPGSLVVSRQTYQFQIRTAASATPSEITGLALDLDVPDVDEVLDDVVIASGGTRLPITQSYRTIEQIGYDFQDDGNDARALLILDKDPVRGPLVRALDTDDTYVAALMDFRLRGIAGLPALDS